MSETLYIHLASKAEQPCHWLIWSPQENEIIASGELSNAQQLDQLTSHASSRKTVVFASSSAVNLKTVELPKKAQRKFLQAIPYMLEEELAEDVDDCCFLLGDSKDSQQQVVVVNRQQIQHWIQWLKDADIKPQQLIPDVLALPKNNDKWTVLQLGEQVLVRSSDWDGFSCEQDWAEQALNLALTGLDLPVTIDNYSQLNLNNVVNCQPQQQELELPLLVLAKNCGRLNMLQGEFQQKKKSNGTWQHWRIAAILAGVALLGNLSIKSAELYQLNAQQTELKQQINQTFKTAFPETRRIVNVRSQLKQKLNALGQGDGNVSVLAMLSQLTPALQQTNLTADNIKFDGKRAELRLQAKAANFNQFEQFRRLAEQAGFQVQQGAINNQDGAVVGSLNIRSKV